MKKLLLIVLLIISAESRLSGADIKYDILTGFESELFKNTDEMLDWFVENGFHRLIVSPVSRNRVYFNSPTLIGTGDFKFIENKLSPFVKQAHAKGLKVIADIEAMNPNFGGDIHRFTIKEVSSMVQEILDTGVDAIVEEDFDEVPDQLATITKVCRKNGVPHIHFTNNPVICGFYTWFTHPLTVFEYYKDFDEISCLDYTIDVKKETACGYFQDNSLVYGVAKGLGSKLDILSAWGTSWGWGIQLPSMMKHLLFIRALQFDLNSIGICLWASPPSLIDISEHKKLIEKYTTKQVKKPVFNLVIPLKYDANWDYVKYSSEAICSGALLSGYDLIVTDEALPDADAYYILTRGYNAKRLLDVSDRITSIFNTDKPIFLQCVESIPSGTQLTSNWKTVLNKVGLKTNNIKYKTGELPSRGVYKGITHKYEGYDYDELENIRKGTIIPESAVLGTIYSKANNFPLLIGRNKKYLFTGSCLGGENSFLIANLLANTLQKPADIFGVVGKKVSAFVAVNNTRLEVELPTKASKIQVIKYNCSGDIKVDEDIAYKPPYEINLLQGDLLIIEAK